MRSPISRGVAVAFVALAGAFLTAMPAHAAGQDGVCNSYTSNTDSRGEICLYFNSGQQGSIWDRSFAAGPVSNFGSPVQTFQTAGKAGYGQTVKNNAGSGRNSYGSETADIFFNSNFMGAVDPISPRGISALPHTYNENASLRWRE